MRFIAKEASYYRCTQHEGIHPKHRYCMERAHQQTSKAPVVQAVRARSFCAGLLYPPDGMRGGNHSSCLAGNLIHVKATDKTKRCDDAGT